MFRKRDQTLLEKMGCAIMDRIDKRVTVEPVSKNKMLGVKCRTSSENKKNVIKAVDIQIQRYSNNTRISPEEIESIILYRKSKIYLY